MIKWQRLLGCLQNPRWIPQQAIFLCLLLLLLKSLVYHFPFMQVVTHSLCPEKDRFIIVASDGVFEFLTSQEVQHHIDSPCMTYGPLTRTLQVVDIVARYDDPVEACDTVTQVSCQSSTISLLLWPCI